MVSYEQLTGTNDNLQDAALIDNGPLVGTLTTFYPATRVVRTLASYAPYAKDIWEGRNLLFHKPFDQMNRQEIKDYGKIGKQYYQNYLQKNPAFIKNYGEVFFGRTNKGKDTTRNMEQYPFLRKNLETSKQGVNTNTKNEIDRNYDHFINTHKGNLYHYLIENITKDGKRYKMMKNKTLGE